MRKTKTGAGGSAAKQNATPKSIDEYLALVPEPARATLNKMRAVIRSIVPKETTEAISYGMPAFKYKGALVWLAAFSDHCSFFPGNSSLIATFQKELKGFETSKGTIRFPMDKPLSTALLKKIVKARIADNDKKQKR